MLNLLFFALKSSFSRSSWLRFAELANLTSVQKSLFQINLFYERCWQLEHLIEGTFEDIQLSIFVIFRLWNAL